VMAALVESGLKNLNFGDADSVGFFQMRLSVWQDDYPGYPEDPAKQLDWFLDTAERVKAQRLSRGQSIGDPSQYGEWIADIERPAEQYRGRYQLQLDQANQLLANAPTAAPEPATPAAREVTDAPAVDAVGADNRGPDMEAARDALLANANVDLPPAAQSDLEQGVVDPRLIAVLADLAQEHRIGLSVIKTGHDKFTSGGSVSNHFVGRGLDIASVDGAPVSSSNAAAREVVSALAALDGDIRPTEVGSPWAIAAPGFFTDAGHQDHIHVGFDEQLPAAFRMPAPAVPGTAVPTAPAPVPVSKELPPARVEPLNSGLFEAIGVRQDRELAAGGWRAAAMEPGSRTPSGASALFLKAITDEEAANAKAVAEPAAAPAPPPAEAPPAASPAAPEPAPAGPPPDLSGVPADYPGDDAGQEALAKWLAKSAEKAGLPPELPVMAALVESGVKNLNFGDADSVGFFQMRVGIWNKGEYAGYPDNPGLQIKWFIDTALAHKRQQIARGDADFGKDPGTWGEWIADVERPAEQFRGRYQLRLDEARRLLR
jgi:hypothetical protein